jgi:SAM-dependent methyltransferase
VAVLARELGWTARDRVLDLGAGPAHVSVRLARHVREVVVMDPEPAMIEEGRRRAADAGVSNLLFVIGGSDELDLVSGRFAAVAMGQSFHWMGDQDRVLEQLAGVTDVVVILSYVKAVDANEAWLSRPPWNSVAEIVARHANPAPPRRSHDPFPEIFARSPFSRVDVLTHEHDDEARPSVDAAIGLQYSLGYMLARLGERRAAFEAEVRAALAGADTTPFEVRVVDGALIARKP